tara:strand:+ start:4807 stop:4974 length:168 start_codon:yes stop_codon:yes gene_type:complete
MFNISNHPILSLAEDALVFFVRAVFVLHLPSIIGREDADSVAGDGKKLIGGDLRE